MHGEVLRKVEQRGKSVMPWWLEQVRLSAALGRVNTGDWDAMRIM
jgi:hypothetical protein